MSLKTWEGYGVHAKTMHIHKNEFLQGLLRLLDTEYNTNNMGTFFSVPILGTPTRKSVLQLPGLVV